jgi:hypothetical protein
MTRARLRLVALVPSILAAYGADCDPKPVHEVAIVATTGTPPSKTLTVQNPSEDLPAAVTLSAGVVVAVRCWDTCDYTCEDFAITAADPTLVRIVPIDRGTSYDRTIAIVALKAGVSTLTVTSRCASQAYPLTITAD